MPFVQMSPGSVQVFRGQADKKKRKWSIRKDGEKRLKNTHFRRAPGQPGIVTAQVKLATRPKKGEQRIGPSLLLISLWKRNW
jgi:hypothetical protein